MTMILLVATLTLTACDVDGGGGDGGGGGGGYEIGDTGPSGVGIVFYVTDGGLHGLEVAPVDQSSSVPAWSNIHDVEIGTTGTTIGSGSANTDAIIGQTGHTESAAQICRDYRTAEEGDWFLPSKDELNSMYTNLHDQPTPLGDFYNTDYWSSSEISDIRAWKQSFDSGLQIQSIKDDHSWNVRAVRAF